MHTVIRLAGRALAATAAMTLSIPSAGAATTGADASAGR
jgi:hypothetical protein